jgi:hypothetical protein
MQQAAARVAVIQNAADVVDDEVNRAMQMR